MKYILEQKVGQIYDAILEANTVPRLQLIVELLYHKNMPKVKRSSFRIISKEDGSIMATFD